MPRIVHLGVGNFFRAHLAHYTARAGGGWTITGVSLRSAAVRDALAPRDFAYTLAIKDRSGVDYQSITVIDQMLVAPENPQAVVDQIADPGTRIVSVTVTEKGYHLDGAGLLALDDPAIQQNLAGPPGTIYGLLAAGLRARKATGAGPVTLLSCDNLAANGPTLFAALMAFLDVAAPDIVEWVRANVTAPAAMVDRITPATTDDLRSEVARATGQAEAAPVETEAFSEWVIEDRFVSDRPDWASVGVVLVKDVAPYEMRKLRLLNGAHSYLAYAGTLAGHSFVHGAISDAALRKTARAVMAEAAATLPHQTRRDADAYADALIARFENPGLRHRLRQIAMDGTQKLPQRLVATWRDRDALGQTSPAIEAAIGAWMKFAMAEHAAGRSLDDPRAEAITKAVRSGTPIADLGALIVAPDKLLASTVLIAAAT